MPRATRRLKRSTLTDKDQALLDRIRATVREIEPDARIILYGSRARGDADSASDWDLLILLDGPVDYQRKERIHHRLYELELELEDCPVLSAVVHSEEEWTSPLYRAMPFHENVTREGMEL